MLQLSFAIGIFVAFIALFVDCVAALSIKSKTASGNGCSSEHWVAPAVILSKPNFTIIEILYPDLGPEVTVEQGSPFAAKSCQVILELDEIPVGQQVSTTATDHTALFYAYEADWIYQFTSEIQYGDGPIAIGSQQHNVTNNGPFGGAAVGGVSLIRDKGTGPGNGTVDTRVWSPCIRSGDTLQMSVNERWAIKQTTLRYSLTASSRPAWIESGDFSASLVRYRLDFKPC